MAICTRAGTSASAASAAAIAPFMSPASSSCLITAGMDGHRSVSLSDIIPEVPVIRMISEPVTNSQGDGPAGNG